MASAACSRRGLGCLTDPSPPVIERLALLVFSGSAAPHGVRCVCSEQASELPRWRLQRSIWWSVSLQRGALRALPDLYVGYALLATRGDLYLDAPGLPGRRTTLESYLHDAVLVAGVDPLLIYTFGQGHAPLE